MDNDAFVGFNEDAFNRHILTMRNVPGCLFTCAPDVVGDAKETLKQFKNWELLIHYAGLPVALVAQDGLENLEIPWDYFEALFIGGSTQWKLGREVRWLIKEAKKYQKWVHMGRVNSVPRIRYAQSIGVDSVDGSGYSINFSHVYKHLPVLQSRQYVLPNFLS